MNNTSRLWKVLGALLVVSFGILLYFGPRDLSEAPPMPAAVKSATGQTLYTRADMEKGREVWQRIGGQQLGSIWGHGSYVAPDWSADWLHREATGLLDLWSQRQYGKSYAELDAERRQCCARSCSRRCGPTPTTLTRASWSSPRTGLRSSPQWRITTRACSATTRASTRCAHSTRSSAIRSRTPSTAGP